jgi:chorismate dehydratase
MDDRLAKDGVSVAAVGYLNARPLTDALLSDRRFRLDFGTPADASARMRSGAADLGLLPTAEIARLGLSIVSDACVAAFGPVDSVLLFLKTAPAGVRRVALDVASRTSRELATWFLRSVGARFTVADARPSAALDDAAFDAVLAIGDDALDLSRRDLPRVDLSLAWARAEGLPFVFAAWGATPAAAEIPFLPEALAAARDAGVRRLSEIAASAAKPGGIDAAAASIYLGRRLRYVFGPAEERGLARFFDVAGLPRPRRVAR